MNASAMLDRAVTLLARQNVTGTNRVLLLGFMNDVRRAVVRDKTVWKFFDYRTVTHTEGVIDSAAQSVKFARTIEYIDTANAITKLTRLKSLDDARDVGYTDLTATGDPQYYLEIGTSIYILAVPTTGTIKIYGEFWPADLTDSTASTDITTTELPEAWIYLAMAEYLDYLGELEKGKYWREKGFAIVSQYLKAATKERTYNVLLSRDPLGNGGVY